MSRSLRVFVSSTMKDLANERDAVCRRLREFNLEPVNAEGWLPIGNSSWARIAEEIESSHVLLLLLGERYGWIPPDGPKSDAGLSVTHLEYREACRLGLPIIPFQKTLSYDTERNSDDACRRDKFRTEVGEWNKGRFIGKFELAHDLAENAAQSLLQLLMEDYLRHKIQERAPFADQTARRIELRSAQQTSAPHVEIPEQLASAVSNREAVLFAGAGVSLAAGLPSAAALSEHLFRVFFADRSGGSHPDLSFAQIAGAVQLLHSRESLASELSKLLSPPQGSEPTDAHTKAIQLFDTVITTNWDNLFERAAATQGEQLVVVEGEMQSSLPANGKAIVKLHGSLENPSSLILTEYEVFHMAMSHQRLWRECCQLLSVRTPIFLGTSLNDPSVIRLLEESRLPNGGYFVAPSITPASEARLDAWHLQCIVAEADTFLEALRIRIERNSG